MKWRTDLCAVIAGKTVHTKHVLPGNIPTTHPLTGNVVGVVWTHHLLMGAQG